MLCLFLVKLQFTFWFTIKFSSNFSHYFILEIRLLLFNRCPLISRRQLLFYYFNEACIIIGKMNIRPNGSRSPRGKHVFSVWILEKQSNSFYSLIIFNKPIFPVLIYFFYYYGTVFLFVRFKVLVTILLSQVTHWTVLKCYWEEIIC